MPPPLSPKLTGSMEQDLPYLSVFKNGVLVESLCLRGLDGMVFGRHSNCDLMVTHPSVSRHHLEMQILHSSRELLITDLDSVHGTWINGEQVLPLVPVTVKEGDTFKLGASSRLYSVQWRSRPPQNSKSVEDCSDNSDSNIPFVQSKDDDDQGTRGSMTTMESKKYSQLDENNALRLTCIIGCTKDGGDINAAENQTDNQNYEVSAIVSNTTKEVCISDAEKLSEVVRVDDGNAMPLPNGTYQKVTSLSCLNGERFDCMPGNEKWSQLVDSEGIKSEYLSGDQAVLEASEHSRDSMHIPHSCIAACIGRSNDQVDLESLKQKPGHSTHITHSCIAACIGGSNNQGDMDSLAQKPEVTQAATHLQNFESKINQENFTEAKEDRQSRREKSADDANSSKLWIRRSKSNPPPNLLTSTLFSVPLTIQEGKCCPQPSAPPMPLSYLINSFVPSPPLLYSRQLLMVSTNRRAEDRRSVHELTEEDDKENSLVGKICETRKSDYNTCNDQPVVDVAVSEDLSDKENDGPESKRTKENKSTIHDSNIYQERSLLMNAEESRRPFQPLSLTSNGGFKLLSLACHSGGSLVDGDSSMKIKRRSSSPVIHNLDLMLTSPKEPTQSEPRRAWHIVVDIGCFLDSKSFKSLQQLEGIREVRLIIPKIVISELSFLRRGMGRPQHKALSWIESCMVKLPSWIHVQCSSETMPLASTPPLSPISARPFYGGEFENMVSPTTGDHVLNCALVFKGTVSCGQVVLLTNHVALKIKTMAEGIISEAPCSFCESLLNPYSERFLWSNSVAHGRSWTENPCRIRSCSALAPSVLYDEQSAKGKGAVLSTVRAMSSRKHHSVEGLRKQCCKQARGLRAALP